MTAKTGNLKYLVLLIFCLFVASAEAGFMDMETFEPMTEIDCA